MVGLVRRRRDKVIPELAAGLKRIENGDRGLPGKSAKRFYTSIHLHRGPCRSSWKGGGPLAESVNFYCCSPSGALLEI